MTDKRTETTYEDVPGGYIVRRIHKNRNIKLEIPPGVYEPVFDHDRQELRLVPRGERFVVPAGKRYGIYTNVLESIKKGLSTNSTRPTGILAMGDPGAGKTLIGKEISNYLIHAGMHVVFIDKYFPLEVLRELTRSMCPAVFFLDEFSKNFYGESHMSANNQVHGQFLSILEDHTLAGNVYFMTCNTNDINRLEGIRSRPGRVLFNVPTNEMLITGSNELLVEAALPDDIKSLLRLCILGGKSGTTENRFNLDNLQKMISHYKPGMTLEAYMFELLPYNLPKLRVPELTLKAAFAENTKTPMTVVEKDGVYTFYALNEKNERLEPPVDTLTVNVKTIAEAAFGKYGFRDRIRLTSDQGKVRLVSSSRVDYGHFETSDAAYDFNFANHLTIESSVAGTGFMNRYRDPQNKDLFKKF